MLREAVLEGWCYTHNGRPRGPISPAQLKGLLVSGQVHPQQAVWRSGDQGRAVVTATAAVLSGEEVCAA